MALLWDSEPFIAGWLCWFIKMFGLLGQYQTMGEGNEQLILVPWRSKYCFKSHCIRPNGHHEPWIWSYLLYWNLGNVLILWDNFWCTGFVFGLMVWSKKHVVITLFLFTFQTTKAFLPKMLELNHGHIVTVASSLGLFSTAGVEVCWDFLKQPMCITVICIVKIAVQKLTHKPLEKRFSVIWKANALSMTLYSVKRCQQIKLQGILLYYQ